MGKTQTVIASTSGRPDGLLEGSRSLFSLPLLQPPPRSQPKRRRTVKRLSARDRLDLPFGYQSSGGPTSTSACCPMSYSAWKQTFRYFKRWLIEIRGGTTNFVVLGVAVPFDQVCARLCQLSGERHFPPEHGSRHLPDRGQHHHRLRWTASSVGVSHLSKQ